MHTFDTEKALNFLKVAGALKDLERFRGQFFWRDYPQRQRYESVADHTWRMAVILMLVEKSLSQPIDFSKAVKMALIHDLAEIIAGDLSPLGTDGTGRDSHLYNKEKAKEKLVNEEKAMREILSNLSPEIRDELYDLWMEYERQENFESRVVKAIDKIESKLQVLEYQKGEMFKNHLDFTLKFGENIYNVDPVLQQLGEAINEEFKREFKEFKPVKTKDAG